MNNPFSSMFPFLVQQQPQAIQQPHVLGERVPVRVQAAMEYLHHATMKGAPVAASGMSGNVDWHEGQSLSKSELMVQSSACDLLCEYFMGTLKANEYESHAIDLAKKTPEDTRKKTLMTCHGCAGSVGSDCILCGGTGKIFVMGA